MPIFSVARAGRRQEGYLENLITSMYSEETAIYRMGYGVCGIDADMIINSFYSVQNTFGKNKPIKVHYMEIYIEKEFGIETTLRIADLFGRYICGQGFQCYTSTLDSNEYYLIVVAVNAVSYMNGRAFHDNNLQYVNICDFLKSIMPEDWQTEIADNTFFNLEDGTNNYVHGKLM